MPAIYSPEMAMAGFGMLGDIVPAINYVARLDGATQYWQLSEDITHGNNDFSVSCKFKTELSGVQNHIIDYSQDLYFKITINTVGVIYVLIGDGFGWSYFPSCESVVNDGLEHSVRVEKLNGILNVYVDGIQEASINAPAVVDVRISSLGKRANSTQYFEGVVYDFISEGALTHEIPLTNKAQGATQLATVGSVNATLINYTEAVWEEV